MIVARLQGGLGNQLFQYALGLTLAKANHVDLLLDISDFPDGNGRVYQLPVLGIKEKIADAKLIYRLKYGSPLKGRINHVVNRLTCGHWSWLAHSWLKETTPGVFCKHILDWKGDAYLDGYWQNEKYFSLVAEDLRRKLCPAHVSESAQKFLLQVPEGIGIHVRRGDYVNDAKTYAEHGCCSKKYYEAALNYLKKNAVSGPLFFFSDDPEWVEENLISRWGGTMISNEMHEADELWLMAHCRANVIANSSFSWWGAWLNRNPEKTVIAPLRWFCNPHRKTAEIVPPHWIRL